MACLARSPNELANPESAAGHDRAHRHRSGIHANLAAVKNAINHAGGATARADLIDTASAR
jgi:hypothetical protein